MARLIVSTLPDLNSIGAFVANSEGVPAAGLGLANFKVGASDPGADASFLTLSQVAPSALRGFYVLNFKTVESPPHRRGLYVFDLIVEMGEDRGSVVSSVVIS